MFVLLVRPAREFNGVHDRMIGKSYAGFTALLKISGTGRHCWIWTTLTNPNDWIKFYRSLWLLPVINGPITKITIKIWNMKFFAIKRMSGFFYRLASCVLLLFLIYIRFVKKGADIYLFFTACNLIIKLGKKRNLIMWNLFIF